MKIPKKTKRFCPYCNKQTNQKLKEPSKGKPSSLKRGGKLRIQLRGLWRGIGNQGKFSRLKNQQKGKRKTTKKTNIVYTCDVCKKGKYQKSGKRTSKLVLE
ncbi:MAG: large subunit ribosomal protein L44e [Patescibacteria group bacterium]|jgi:large subunit ribosomal protein L44e